MGKPKGQYRFSFGPWNIDEGSDPFGPEVRRPVTLKKKIKAAKDLGFKPRVGLEEGLRQAVRWYRNEGLI